MSENRNIYKIDRDKYVILKHLCLRYWEHKHKIENILKSGGGSGFITYSKSAGRYSDPTANKAVLIDELRGDCELVETAVKKVCADYEAKSDEKNLLCLSDFLLLNVTTFNQYNSYRSFIKRGYKLPVGRDKFYFLRYKFFYELNRIYN